MTVSFSLSKRVKYDPRCCPIFMTQKALLSQSVVDPQNFIVPVYILNEAQTLLLTIPLLSTAHESLSRQIDLSILKNISETAEGFYTH